MYSEIGYLIIFLNLFANRLLIYLVNPITYYYNLKSKFLIYTDKIKGFHRLDFLLRSLMLEQNSKYEITILN